MAFITVAGQNQIAAKQGASAVLNITHFVLAYIAGLGSEPVNRIEAMPSAGNIKATLPVTAHGYVNTNQVVYSLVMDSSLGDYDFNWIGLKDADGILIAVAYVPTIHKVANAGAVPGNNLTRNFLLAYSGISATTAISVPAETWQIDFNTRLWGIDERERLSNLDIYGHEAFFDDGWKVVRQGASTNYDVLAGIGYVGGLRAKNLTTQVISVTGPPKNVWLDVSLQGDISDVATVVAFIIDNAAHTDYTDGLGFKHYVSKIAGISSGGVVTDTRVLCYIPISQATESRLGIAELATQAETDAGTDDLRIVTPKKLCWGFSSQLNNTGYFKFPSWLGGLILQWGRGSAINPIDTFEQAAYTVITTPVSFPATFPNSIFTAYVSGGSQVGASNEEFEHIYSASEWTLSGMKIRQVRVFGNNPSDQEITYFNWLVFGR